MVDNLLQAPDLTEPEGLSQYLGDLTQEINSLTQQFKQSNVSLDTVKDLLTSTDLDVDTLQAALLAIVVSITQNESDIADNLTKINTNIANINTNITNIATNVTNINTNAANIANHESRITTLEGFH